jgi:transposase
MPLLCSNVFLLSCALEAKSMTAFFSLHISSAALTHLLSFPLLHATMKQFAAEQKHAILLEYSPRDRSRSFSQLARRHSVAGGERTVRRWFARWNRTVASLQHKAVKGRPRVLTQTEVQRHIAVPIRRLNRSFRPARYRDIAQQLRQKTGKQISDRTVRRYGKEQLGIKKGRGKKRTTEESKCKDASKSEEKRLLACAID